jgi:hypothetical protein
MSFDAALLLKRKRRLFLPNPSCTRKKSAKISSGHGWLLFDCSLFHISLSLQDSAARSRCKQIRCNAKRPEASFFKTRVGVNFAPRREQSQSQR